MRLPRSSFGRLAMTDRTFFIFANFLRFYTGNPSRVYYIIYVAREGNHHTSQAVRNDEKSLLSANGYRVNS